MGKSRIAATSVLLFVVTGVIGACASDSGDGDAGADTSTAAQVAAHKGDTRLGRNRVQYGGTDTQSAALDDTQGVGEVRASDSSGTAVGEVLQRTPEIGPSVIKTADMSVEIERGDFQDALQDAIAVAGQHGGFILTTSVDDAKRRSGSVTLRVPAENFEDALTALEDLGTVEAQTVTGRDVSQEFIDLGARIRNLQAQERVLLRLMREAQTVTDTIRVQHELQSVQLEIERLKGRLRWLRNQADMSTISVSLFEAGVVPSDEKPAGVLGKAWQRAVDVALTVVSAVIVGTGALVPVAALLALAFLVLRALRPKLSSS